MRKRREVHTVDDLIELLGSPDAAAEAFGVTKPAVHNWRQRGVPLKHYRLVSKLMADLKATAADDLFAGGAAGSGSGAKGWRVLTTGRRPTPAGRLTTSARAALIARLRKQPVLKAGRWTREELYERSR